MSGPEPRVLTEDPATTFLLAEHARLAELYLVTRETAERRVTLFLTLTTTVVGALVALFQFKLAPRDFLETALAGAVGVLLLGASTFHRVIERSMQGTEYLRAINRIHHFFVKRAPEIEPYLYWPPYDDVPHYDFRGVGGAETREIVMLIDSLFFGAALGLSLLIGIPDQLIASLALGAAGVAVAVYLHQRYERFSMAREEKRKANQVRFPQKV
jgi:hypothetical protein